MKSKTVNNKQLAATAGAKKLKQRDPQYAPTLVKKSISITRQDIATWKAAEQAAYNVQMPKRTRLHRLFKDILKDAHLTSQISNRRLQTVGAPFVIKDSNGKIDLDTTLQVMKSKWQQDIAGHMWDTIACGNSLLEFSIDKNGKLKVDLLNRENVVPDQGRWYPDSDNSNYIEYREMKEYGNWLVELGSPDDLGLLNKAVPHVLMKRFSISCWSELCEIYGIPPRVMKTNTQDPAMLQRAEQMMQDMGAAAWFIIDEEEEFEFAQGVTTTGDVYNNLIRVCNNEMSLLFSGAVIGQDTKHGNESKENSSIKILDKLVAADKRMCETLWNETVLPSLFLIGVLPEGLQLEYVAEEDIEKLWKMIIDLLPHMDIDPEWIKNKFGIEVTGKRAPAKKNDLHFFQ
ncbi:DUF935 domain-containing protein [Chitinophaga pendula]|uniref:phage portal protein family protein n=1 Tax=Chitinophaga TaxID=79328 RepID=UPI000BB00166|nr:MULTISPECIES: DUF935 family protein [Chitinophaga]ASZ11085.1 hypothetical protein CK934_08985 [Chitinophaga sp. MD30]UCJ05918.1 DUF935 domain-containing protein [Chitinophaga pendula]